MQSNKKIKGEAGASSLTRLIIKIVLVYGTVIILILLLKQVPLTNAAEKLPAVPSFCEIMPNPDGSDTKNNEYFKLLNSSLEAVSLNDWKVCNISNNCYTLNVSVAAENCLKILRADFDFTLHNDKEELNLYDPEGNLIDQIATGTASSGKAWQCYQKNCAWGEPQDSCDYSFLAPLEEEPAPEDNANANENPPEVNENSNDNSAGNEQANNNTNDSARAEKLLSYPINDTKDFSRLRKILRKEKQISILADIKGVVAIPPGIMGKTYFYLTFEGNLFKVHVYSSCQNSPDCLRDIKLARGKKLSLQNALFKIIDGRFEIFLDKNARIKETGSKKFKKAVVPEKDKNQDAAAGLRKKVGQEIKISGNVVVKKGDYFFVEDKKSGNVVSVYIPKPLQNAYAKRLDPVPLGYFPFYLAAAQSKSWIGGLVEASGIVETAGQEYRVIAYKLDKLQPTSNKPEEKSKSDDKEGPKKSSPTSVGSSLKPAAPERRSFGREPATGNKNNENANKTISQSATQEISKDKVKEILSQNLSWQSLWKIFLIKLTTEISSFHQYF